MPQPITHHKHTTTQTSNILVCTAHERGEVAVIDDKIVETYYSRDQLVWRTVLL